MDHLIKKQVILLNIDKKMDAFRIQHAVSGHYRTAVMPLMQKVFDKLCGEDEIIELDKLEIDLGVFSLESIEQNKWEAGLEQKIEQQLQALILAVRSRQRGGLLSKPISVCRQWLFYMQNGYLPWNTLKVDGRWYENVLEALAVDFDSVQALRNLIAGEGAPLQRIVLQHSPGFLQRLAGILTAQNQPLLKAVIEELWILFSYLQQKMEVAARVSERKFKNDSWVLLLLFAAAPKEAFSEKLPALLIGAFVKEHLVVSRLPAKLAVRLPIAFPFISRFMAELRATIQKERSRIAKAGKVLKTKSIQPEETPKSKPALREDTKTVETPKSLPAIKPGDTANEVTSAPKDGSEEMRFSNQGIAAEATAPGMKNEQSVVDPGPRTGIPAEREGGPGAAPELPPRKAITESTGEAAPKGKMEIPAPPDTGGGNRSDVAPAREMGPASRQDERFDGGIGRTSQQVTSPGQPPADEGSALIAGEPARLADDSTGGSFIREGYTSIGEEGIFVSNAGLVLLHPFLNALFTRVSFVNEGKFVDLLAHQKALHLLHYLATTGRHAPEHDLVIPKVLCVYPLHAPVNLEIDLEENILAEADQMLVAAIQQWGILKNTSPAGLREGFLQRNGKLFSRNDKLYVQVEQHSIDILLDHLPWNLSMVRLPWMKEILRVEWR